MSLKARKFFTVVFSLAAVIIFCAGAYAETHVLDNGLTVLIHDIPSSSSVSVYGLVKAGSATEGSYLGAGLSHFMEHMLFKGTEKRGVGEIPKQIQALGGTINASTSFDYTIYTITVPKQHFETALDILSDMLFSAAFDPQELSSERNVIFREMKMYEDHPGRQLSRGVFETAYLRHPYRFPIIGFEDLLRPLSREDFLSYYHQQYVPNNIVLSIAGAVESSSALERVKKFFGHYPRARHLLRQLPQEPSQLRQRYMEQHFSTELLRMSVVYQGVDVFDPDMIALDALAIILGKGESSRLHQSLREKKKIVHSISALNFTPQDRGLFEIEVVSVKDNVNEILSAIDKEISQLARQGVSAQELEKVINGELKSLYERKLRSSDSAYQAAVDFAITGDAEFSDWYADAFAKLTSDDIARVAKKYLVKGRRSIVVLKPKKWETAAEGQKDSLAEQSSIQRYKLDNGLTVLMKYDKAVPLVWINFVSDGGIYRDDVGKDGLSNFVSQLWIKGSKKFSNNDIARLTEQKGISLSSFSGKQSIGIRISALSKDLDFCLAMLADMVANPLFKAETARHQRQLIQAAIQGRADDIVKVGGDALNQALFEGHPLAKTRLGTIDSIESISAEDIVHFYQHNVLPQNAVISIFGDIDPDDVLKRMIKYFAVWRGHKTLAAQDEMGFSFKSSKRGIDQTILVDKDEALVMVGFSAEDFYHPDRYGLEILGAMIGSPFKGRMFSEIRDREGLAYRLGGGFMPFKDAGMLRFYLLTEPESVEAAIASFHHVIADMMKNGITEEELSHAKSYLIGSHQRSADMPEQLSFMSALDELYGLGHDRYLNYERLINEVTLADIERLAGQYLVNSAIIRVLPGKSSE